MNYKVFIKRKFIFSVSELIYYMFSRAIVSLMEGLLKKFPNTEKMKYMTV